MVGVLVRPVDNNFTRGEGRKLLEEAAGEVDLVGSAALGAEVGNVAVQRLAVALDLDALAAVSTIVPSLGREGNSPDVVADVPTAGTRVSVGLKVGGMAGMDDGGGEDGEDGEVHLQVSLAEELCVLRISCQ